MENNLRIKDLKIIYKQRWKVFKILEEKQFEIPIKIKITSIY